MERFLVAPDNIFTEDGRILYRKNERVRISDGEEDIEKQLRDKGLVGELEVPHETSVVDVVDQLTGAAPGASGFDFSDPSGDDSTAVHVAKSAAKGLASSVLHGVTGLEKGIVGGTLDVVSAGARVLGGEKLADQLQEAKRFNEQMMDTKAVDDLILNGSFDNSREAWDAMMGVSEGLGSIAGGVAAAKPLAAGLKATNAAKTAEGAMKGAFAVQMAAGGEENARAQILQGENRDLTWREKGEVAYHTAKEAIKSQFFGRVVGAFGKKIGNAGAAALEFGGINAADVLADAYIGDNIAGRQWKDENGNVLTGNDKVMAVLQKAGASFLYGGMQSLLMSMGGGIVGAPKKVAANREKVVKEPPPVVAEGANGERVLEGGVLVRPVEGGAEGELEMVTPDGVVLDAEGKVKTVAAGGVGQTGDNSYGIAITTRTNPLTGRPTAARETVRNALVALQEGVTIDQLREIDGWTPENKAVFEVVARLKQGLAEGMPAGELVDALAGLGIGEAEARAFGFIPEGNRYVGDALAVANNGTRQLQNAVGNGSPGHIPLEIAAEVVRSVNAGTTGLMPEELGKRQLEVARQLMAERAKAELEQGAAEHGNTPEAERAVLDTPVEQPDGTLTTLGEMAGTAGTTGTGNLPEVSVVPEVPAASPVPGTASTMRARHDREQSVRALGLKPLGDGAYGVGRFPQMRVEKADGVSDDSGRPVSAIRVTGLDPAEMLRPENILDMARVLGDLQEKCAERGVRVDFEPEAMDAVAEVMAKWETDVRTDPVLRARSEVVTSLLEKSGLASGIVTDQAAFEAALRAAGGEKAEKLIVDGLTYGFTDGERVYLNPAFFGTKVGLNTPIHEFGHLGIIACRKINRPLYDRGIDLIKQTKYWQEVTEHPDYKNDNPVKNAEEALTRLIADRGEKLSAETPKGVLAEIKQWLVDFWKTFGNSLGLRDITPEQVEKMTVEQIADAIRAEMLRGERFGTSRAQVEAQRQGGRRLKAGQRKRSPQSYIEAGGGKASKAFAFWAENGRRIMNVPKPGEFGWDIYNQLVLGQKDPAERARIKRILCGDQPKNTRKKGNDEILAEFNRRMGGDGDIYTDESGFQQMVEEFLSSHADYERWRAEGAKSASELEEEARRSGEPPRSPQEAGSQPDSAALEAARLDFDPAELEEWSRIYDESRMAMAEAGLADEPDARVPDDAMWAREPRFSIGGVKGASQMGIKGAGDAEAMEKAGKDREEIWRTTGWWRGKDGKWRVELPPLKMKGAKEIERALRDGGNETTLGKLIDAPDLFKAYPEMESLKIEFSPDVNVSAGAQYDKRSNTITVFNSGLETLANRPRRDQERYAEAQKRVLDEEYLKEVLKKYDDLQIEHGTLEEEREAEKYIMSRIDARIADMNAAIMRRVAEDTGPFSPWSMLVHEIEHAIQEREDFARGGSIDAIRHARSVVLEINRDIRAKMKEAGVQAWKDSKRERDWDAAQKELAGYKNDFELFRAFLEQADIPEEKRREYKTFLDGHERTWKGAMSRAYPGKDPQTVYESFAGEVEARNASRREAMTPEERTATPPWATEDVPEDRQIIRFSRATIGTDKGVFTTKIDTKNPKTKDGKNTVIFRRNPSETTAAVDQSSALKAVEGALPVGVKVGDKGTRYTPEEKQRVKKFVKDAAKAQRGEVENPDFGKILIGRDFVMEVQTHAISTAREIAAVSSAREIATNMKHFAASPNEEKIPGKNLFMEYGLAKFEFEGETYLVMGEVGIRKDSTPYYDQRVVAKLKAEPTPLILHDGMEADSAFDEIYDNRFRILLQAYNEWQQQSGGGGNSDLMLSRGGYKAGDWRKTFTFGKAARGDAEQTPGGIAAGEERRRWEENPVDERIPEWDAPARNPNIAKPFALSSAEGVRLVKLLGGVMKKPKAYKDAIGVIDESDEQRIRDDLKAMGFFKGDDFLWAATATPAEVEADRADSQAALDARLEKLGEQRLKGEAGGGNRGLVRVSMSQVADLVLSLPAETGGNLGNVRTLAQGIVRGFERDRTPEQAAYYFDEARNLLDWFYGGKGEGKGEGEGKGGGDLNHNLNPSPKKLLARAFGAFLEAPDAVAERAPGLYREFVDAISRNDKLLHAFDAIRQTALGEGSAARVLADIEKSRTAEAHLAAKRLKDDMKKPIGTKWENAKDSFIYNFDNMNGPMFMHISRAQKRMLKEYRDLLRKGRITQQEYDAVTAEFDASVKAVEIAQLAVDRGTFGEIYGYMWDMRKWVEEANRAGVGQKDFWSYMDLKWVIATGGRAGALGQSARDAQLSLDAMRRRLGDAGFAAIEAQARKMFAIRERNLLTDPRCAEMIGDESVKYFLNNATYVRTNRIASAEELAQIEADRADFRRRNPNGDDVTAAMIRMMKSAGGEPASGYSTWGHALEGSAKVSEERAVATWRNDTSMMAAMERNHLVHTMRRALLAAKVPGVHDLPAADGVQYPINARYGKIHYFDHGRRRVLVVPRVIADGYNRIEADIKGWDGISRFIHNVFIDWNVAYTGANVARNMGSNEANLVGMRPDNLTIAGNYLAPGVGRLASMVSYELARRLPEVVFRNPVMRMIYGSNTNVMLAKPAQRLLELYLDPRVAVDRQEKADAAAADGDYKPAMKLATDLEVLHMCFKGNALISRLKEVEGQGGADELMMRFGLSPVSGNVMKDPRGAVRKVLDTLNVFRHNSNYNSDLELHAKMVATLHIAERNEQMSAQEVGLEVARRASIPRSELKGSASKWINFGWNMFFATALRGLTRFVGNVKRNPSLLVKMGAFSLGGSLFYKTMIAGGGLSKMLRYLFGDDDTEEGRKKADAAAEAAGLGPLLEWADEQHDMTYCFSDYYQEYYKLCPIKKFGKGPDAVAIAVAVPLSDEERTMQPIVDFMASRLAPRPTDPYVGLGSTIRRMTVGTLIPDISGRSPLVAAALDLIGPIMMDYNPIDTYRGRPVYDKDMFEARNATWKDRGDFAWAMGKQLWNDLGGRAILPPARPNIDDPESTPEAIDAFLRKVPVMSPFLGKFIKISMPKVKRDKEISARATKEIDAVLRRRAAELVQEMIAKGTHFIGYDSLNRMTREEGWDDRIRMRVFVESKNGYNALKRKMNSRQIEARIKKRLKKAPKAVQREVEDLIDEGRR